MVGAARSALAALTTSALCFACGGGAEPRGGGAATVSDVQGRGSSEASGSRAPRAARDAAGGAATRAGGASEVGSGSGEGVSAGAVATALDSAGSAAGGGAPNGPGASADGDGSEWVFDEAQVHTYEVTLPPEAWERLQREALEEEYVEAELDVEGMHLSGIGLRFKGSSGTLVSCFREDGTRVCSKLSMKLEFDEFADGQRFFGLKRLNFNSMVLDDSQLRERLAYRLFQEMGVVAPRAVHARLVVNGEDQGLFTLVESVDGTFTDLHFEGGDGNLYKEQWPNTEDEGLLQSRLETNEETASHELLREFSAELAGAAARDLAEVVGRYTDADELLAYLAVDRTIQDWDGMMTFYCYDGDACENHNYYLYQHEYEPKFTVIPWDLDNTFDLSTPLDGVPSVFDAPEDCDERYPVSGQLAMPPGCDPLIRGLALTDRARYAAQLERLLDGPFQPEVMGAWLDEWALQIEPFVAEDERAPSLEDFWEAVARLRANVSELRERALAELAAAR